jgi:hypothetical protein
VPALTIEERSVLSVHAELSVARAGWVVTLCSSLCHRTSALGSRAIVLLCSARNRGVDALNPTVLRCSERAVFGLKEVTDRAPAHRHLLSVPARLRRRVARPSALLFAELLLR